MICLFVLIFFAMLLLAVVHNLEKKKRVGIMPAPEPYTGPPPTIGDVCEVACPSCRQVLTYATSSFYRPVRCPSCKVRFNLLPPQSLQQALPPPIAKESFGDRFFSTKNLSITGLCLLFAFVVLPFLIPILVIMWILMAIAGSG